MDGDGLPEFALWDSAVDTEDSTHRAYLFVSSAGARLSPGDPGPQSKIFTGPIEEDTFAAMTGAGDVDGDGYADGAFAAPLRGAGEVYVLLGSASLTGDRAIAEAADATYTNTGPTAGFGRAIAGPGDVDADGYPDLAVANARDGDSEGAAWIFAGGAGLAGAWSTDDAVVTISGANTEAEGRALASALDVNGDGASDLLLSAWSSADEDGEAWLAYGSP
jgi:hypothetical protein